MTQHVVNQMYGQQKETGVNAKVYPFSKNGESIIIDNGVPEQLLKMLGEESMNFMYEQTYYSFVYYKESDFYKQKVDKVKNAISALPIPKSGEYNVEIMIDSFDIDFKNLIAGVDNEMTERWNVKSKKEEKATVNVALVTTNQNMVEFKNGQALARALRLTMRLVEMPSNYLTPKQFYEEAKEVQRSCNHLLKHEKVKVDVLIGEELKKSGYGSMYAVSMGSTEDAHLITLTYSGGKEGQKPMVLVGKGLTFDSGGISLKPSRGMGRMKGDMAGAATVLATFMYAVETGSNQNIVAILACAENMPDGGAVKPGDIITAFNGKTIEVEDTDAEGRLVLADALCHAKKFNGEVTVDFATLTGACIVALGHVHTGMFTEDEELSKKFVDLGKKSGDTVWPLPMGAEYNHLLKSDVADLNNLCIGQGAGATNGAVFLKEFAPETGWVHMDIAGTSEVKGATGRPVPLMSDFIDSLNK